MFIYFNQNKLAYHKGQLAPFFIVFIILIIVAALVTVNIGKVAKTKTYSANSVDAGVLASASTMASAFNYIAVANSQMRVNYQYFFGLATVSFVIGYAYMALAMSSTNTALASESVACKNTKCCPSPCGYYSSCPPFYAACAAAVTALTAAIGSLGSFNQTMASLIVQVTGYWLLQVSFYKLIRDNVDDYYQSAIDTGHSFSFSNSGISPKLQGCRLEDSSLCDACEDSCQRDCKGECGVTGDCWDKCGEDKDCRETCQDCLDVCSRGELNCLINNCQSQRAEYQLWLKDNTEDVPNDTIRTYSWLDGQERSHDAASQVIIDPVDNYNLKHTVLPFPAEIALLVLARSFASTAISTLTSAKSQACNPYTACAAWTAIGTASAPEIQALTSSIAAHAGLAVNGTFSSSSGNDVLPYLLCWIDDVPHNQLVDVYQTQRHQGADLGAWSTEYPLTTSSSRASFAGQGDIYPPSPYYDASMTLTDFLAGHLLGGLAVPIKDVEGEMEE